MEYVLSYVLLGALISLGVSLMDKIYPDEEQINNIDRIVFIFVWPIILFGFLKGLFFDRD